MSKSTPSAMTVRVVVGALTATATVGMLGPSAWAATPASLPTIQSKAAAAITVRVNALNRAIDEVDEAKNLGTDQATLVQRMQTDIPALQQLGQKLAADPTVSTARADRTTISTSYRVFALILPSTRLARASDDILNAQVPKLTRASASLNARMTATDQATVAPLIAEVNTQVTAAQAAATGISATVEADTPAQWDANHGLLRAAANSVKAARTDLKTAAADIKQIRSDLKAAH